MEFNFTYPHAWPYRDYVIDAVKPKLLDGAAPEGIWDALVAQAKDAGFEATFRRLRLFTIDGSGCRGRP